MKLFLIHGWGYDGRVWDELQAELRALPIDSQRLDLPGYAGTPAAPAASVDALADYLLANIPEGSIVVAWSLGAMAALAAAAKAPQHFAKLVLIGTNATFVRRDGWPEALDPALLAGFRQALADDAGKLLTRFAALCNQGHDDGQTTPRALARRLSSQNDAPPSPAALADGLQALAEADLQPLLTAVRLPVLLLHGSNDPLMPIAAAERLAAQLADARLESFAGAAHAPFLAEPARCARLIHAFVRSDATTA
jgi:pimeloyl-[acyl-carrier protein] methyl ester esterase